MSHQAERGIGGIRSGCSWLKRAECRMQNDGRARQNDNRPTSEHVCSENSKPQAVGVRHRRVITRLTCKQRDDSSSLEQQADPTLQ